MPENPDQLSSEDLAALHETYMQLQKAGDPRAEKVRSFIVQQGNSILHPTDNRGAIEKAWDWANQGLISKDTFVRAISGMTPDQLNSALAPYASESPAHAAVREFVRGTTQDIGATASQMGTSPLAIGTMGVGAAGKIPGAAGKVAKVVTTGAAAGFAGQGAKQVAEAKPDIHYEGVTQRPETLGFSANPEETQKALTGASMVAGGAAGVGEGLKNVKVPSLQGTLAERMQQSRPGELYTRQEELNAAREHGVNLDVAQATDAPAARAVKKLNEYSLAAEPAYQKNLTKNLNALDKWSEQTASRYAPETTSPEMLGGKVQQALQQHLNARENAATQMFNDLDREVGQSKPDATNVYDLAKRIVAENADYYEKNPALKQGKAWQIVNDLASREAATQPGVKTVQTGMVDAAGNPITREVATAPKAAPDTWNDLQRMRTDLQHEYRSPDIIGSRSEGWLKQLVGEIDNSMTRSGESLTGPQLEQFRKANAIWESIKNTYDNPQSPYYHAIRAQAPSQVVGMLSNGTPELARHVRATLGSLEGPFQRQFVENMISSKDGGLDLGRLNQKLSKVPNDYLVSMIGEDGARELRLLGKVAQKVMKVDNPSGTAQTMQKVGEVKGFFDSINKQQALEGGALLKAPVAALGELAGQYVAGKAMNSPRVVDYLTKPKEPLTPPFEQGPSSPRGRLVSEDDYQQARQNFRNKVGNSNAGIPLDAIPDIAKIGLYHLENGVNAFSDWSKAMVSQLGEQVKPQLQDLYSKLTEKLDSDYRISTRIPKAAKATEDPLAQQLTVGSDVVHANPELAEKLANTVKNYPNIRLHGDEGKSPRMVINKFINHVADNLVWLHNQVPGGVREVTGKWYDTARNEATGLANEYGYTRPQTSGAMAALSPQKDWYMNRSLARRVTDIVTNQKDTVATPEMLAKGKELKENSPIMATILSKIKGKTLGELTDPFQKAAWVRLYDEAHNPRSYEITSPNGKSLGNAKTKAGVDSSVAWGSLNEISKAISILENGSRENIHGSLGEMHKVRNFYNNILLPNNPVHGDVTIDTHAVAAGLLRPLSGNSTEVTHNFGGPGSAITGTQGTYPLYAEAYRKAAAKLGIQPRQLQSITWEAIRDLFPRTFKTKANQGIIDQIWKDYQDGKASLSQTRGRILKAAGGIKEPEWFRSGGEVSGEQRVSSEQGKLPGSSVPGESSSGTQRGGGSKPTGGTPQAEVDNPAVKARKRFQKSR